MNAGVLQVQGTVTRNHGDPVSVVRPLADLGHLGYALLIAGGAVVAVRRRWPVAIVFAVWGQIDLWFIGGAFTSVPGSRLLTAPFLLLFSLPLAFRRRWPFGVLCVVSR